MNPLTDYHSIPQEVLQAAALVNSWMRENGHETWELMDLCSRNHAVQLSRMKLVEQMVKLKRDPSLSTFRMWINWLKSFD